MFYRRSGFFLLAAFVVSLGAGCKKTPAGNGPATRDRAPGTVARVHWLGKKQLAADTNSAHLMEIWRLPESQKLEAQTLDKLASGPARWASARGVDPASLLAAFPPNAASATLRPLFEDLLNQETWFEAKQGGGKVNEAVLAVKLDETRAAFWATNLAKIFPRPAGASAADNGWVVPGTSVRFEAARKRGWTVVGLSSIQGGLMKEVSGRIDKSGAPCTAPATNGWLEIEGDLAQFHPDWPKVSLALTSAAGTVRTRGNLHFPKPLPSKLDPWNVPTNLLNDPIVSFTAVRGIKSTVSDLAFWKDLKAGPAPDQIFAWSQAEIPFLTYFATPLQDADGRADLLAKALIEKYNPVLATHSLGRLEKLQKTNGVAWSQFPFLTPYLRAAALRNGDYIVVGLGGSSLSNNPPPAALINQLYSDPALVYYDWEVTPPRVDAWTYLGQLFRIFSYRTQLPLEGHGIAWIKAVEKRTSNSATMLTKTGPQTMALTRKSTLGLNSVELHLFADWLESPAFPEGLYTLLSTNKIKRPSPPGTNGPQSVPR